MKYVEPSSFAHPASQQIAREINGVRRAMAADADARYAAEAAKIVAAMGWTTPPAKQPQQQPRLQERSRSGLIPAVRPSSGASANDAALAAEARRILADWAAYPPGDVPTI